jgi:O-antigen/teichoic acid export membrane protein
MNIKKEFHNNRSFINNILITIGIGVLINFLNYLFNIFLARNLNTIDFGFYNAAIGIITLAQIPTVAIQTAITKKVASNRNFNLTKFKIKSTLQLTIVALIVSLLFYIFGNQISDIANIPNKYIPSLTLIVFGAILTPSVKGFLLGLEKILSFNLVLLFETVLKFALGYIGIYYAMDISLPILACVLPSFLTFILILPLVKTKSEIHPKRDITLNYKNILLIFFTFLLINIPPNMSLILANPDFRAPYGALALIGKIVYFASITIASVMISKLANTKKELRKKDLVISLVISALTGIAISLIYLFFSEEIVQIVFNGMYMEIVKYIVPYSIAITGYSLVFMIVTSLLVEDSYFHIYFLLAITALQIVLFKINNSSLHDIYINQILIFGVLSIFALLVLIFYIFKKNGKNKEDNKKRT